MESDASDERVAELSTREWPLSVHDSFTMPVVVSPALAVRVARSSFQRVFCSTLRVCSQTLYLLFQFNYNSKHRK